MKRSNRVITINVAKRFPRDSLGDKRRLVPFYNHRGPLSREIVEPYISVFRRRALLLFHCLSSLSKSTESQRLRRVLLLIMKSAGAKGNRVRIHGMGSNARGPIEN